MEQPHDCDIRVLVLCSSIFTCGLTSRFENFYQLYPEKFMASEPLLGLLLSQEDHTKQTQLV